MTINASNDRRRSIVVGFDFSPVSIHALKVALGDWISAPADIHLVHAVDSVPDDHLPGYTQIQKHDFALDVVPDRIADILSQSDLDRPLDGINIYVHVRLDPPVKALIQAAADYEADCIVVGTHGRKGIERVFLGSVAEALVREAPCPVRVERPVNYATVERSPRLAPAVEIDQQQLSERWSYKPVRTTRVPMSSRCVDVLGPSFE